MHVSTGNPLGRYWRLFLIVGFSRGIPRLFVPQDSAERFGGVPFAMKIIDRISIWR